MGLGVLCLLIAFFWGEPAQIAEAGTHARFWSNFLHNAVFFTGIGFIALMTLAGFVTAYAGWFVNFKRVFEAYSQFLVPGLLLMLLVIAGIWGHFHHLYHWADEAAVAADPILQGKSSFLNKYWYTFGTLLIVGAWIFFAKKIRALSIAEDSAAKGDYSYHYKIRFWSAIFLPIAAFSSAAIIWQWVMSLEAHWYSTLFAWYCTISWFVASIALIILTLIYLKSRGYFPTVTEEHLHDLGKYMFAFSIFWTYLWYSQYMLIWYSNVGEETIFFKFRVDNFGVLHYGNLILNFMLPFLILMRNTTKRRYGTLIFTSIICLFGHWWDYFYIIKPAVLKGAQEVLAHGAEAHGHAEALGYVGGFTVPGLLEIGTLLGFLGLFFWVVFRQLEKAQLEATNDPYYEEAVHHEVMPDYSGEGGH